MQRLFRPDQPFPLFLVFPLIFSAVYLLHLSLLRLPYYWDEAGYYIPAALDFYRTGSLIPRSTLSNAHPPLPSIYLALWWRASGFTPAVTRIAMCVMSSLALLGVYRISMVAAKRTLAAAATVLLTALYPVWFAQSTLAHADMFAATGVLWGLSFYLERDARPGRIRSAAVCFALACLAKETAVVTPIALAAYEISAALGTGGARERRAGLGTDALLACSALPLCGWYAYHWRRTGYVFGNPEYLRYNATATLDPLRIAIAFAHRVIHLTAHMNLFVPVVCAAAALVLPPLLTREGRERQGLSAETGKPLLAVIAANVACFSVLGGALLTRYLLPLYPLVLLACVLTIFQRVRLALPLLGLSAAAFVLALFFNPPYRFAPEDNLSYRDAIALHQQAIREIVSHYPASTVLTAWPATDELTRPELGYVRRPVPVVAIENFSLSEIERAESVSNRFTAALVFSTKYDPPQRRYDPQEPGTGLEGRNEALDRRFFDFHRDLHAGQVAGLLGGKVTWQGERTGEWAAVLHFDRPQLALETQPAAHP